MYCVVHNICSHFAATCDLLSPASNYLDYIDYSVSGALFWSLPILEGN